MRLTGSQENDRRNPELIIAESLLDMVASLGLVETAVMARQREDFSLNKSPTDAIVKQRANEYWELGEIMTGRSNTSNDRLAWSILLIVFYLPCQTNLVKSACREAFADAQEIAFQLYRDDLVEKLTNWQRLVFALQS